MENNPLESSSVEIDLLKLARFYLRCWWVIILSGVILASAAFLWTNQLITPLYRSTVTIYVNNTKGSQSMEVISGSNLMAAQQLVNTYVNIIQSNTVLNGVIAEGDLQCTPQDVRNIMTARQVSGTEMFQVSISHPDPKQAAHIANTIANVAPSKISEFVEGSSTKIIDYAELAVAPYTPNYFKNILLGGLLGVILAVAVLTVRHLMDTRIRSESDLQQMFDLPVLGLIPDYAGMSDEKNAQYEQYGYGGGKEKK